MILIEKNKTNQVALTLTENSSLTGDTYYLFVFTNDGKNQEKIFTAPDISPYKDRYNHFEIAEYSGGEDLLDGIIHLTGQTSQWTYKVYESNIPFSADTLDVIWTTRQVIEEGRVLVRGKEGNTSINNVYL